MLELGKLDFKIHVCKYINLNDFTYLSQDMDSKVLDLVKKKVFYFYEYIRDFDEKC